MENKYQHGYKEATGKGLADYLASKRIQDMSQHMQSIEDYVRGLNLPVAKQTPSPTPNPSPRKYIDKATIETKVPSRSKWDEPCSIKGVVLVTLTGVTLPIIVALLLKYFLL